MNKVLDEVCKDTIHATQQAFFSGRDILVNNIRMHTVFREWAARSGSGDQVLLLLLLDCSKGCNFLSWSWIRRCLRRARLPQQLCTMIESMIEGEVRLVIQEFERGGMRFLAGLHQVCPLSCFLFFICADPLLQATFGFVDDWAAACGGGTFAEAHCSLNVALACVEEFERASGSRIN